MYFKTHSFVFKKTNPSFTAVLAIRGLNDSVSNWNFFILVLQVQLKFYVLLNFVEKKLISGCPICVVFPVMGTMGVAKIFGKWRSFSINSIFSAIPVAQLNSTICFWSSFSKSQASAGL